MYRFKQFIIRNVIVKESLDDYQKRIVNTWDTGDLSFSDHVFKDHPQGRHYTPLEADPDNEVTPHPDVQKHLETHGYKIHDYRKGLAIDKYDRHQSIGKILNKTKAPTELKKTFENDPKRQAIKPNYKVAFSRNIYDVASMSTNRGWRSCMAMDGGSNKAYLPHDVENGTHVAYLIHKDDHDIENPTSRIALKPFHSQSGHTILRPEQSMYGQGSDDFAHTVRKWSEHHFPPKPKEIYTLNPNVYNDSIEHEHVFSNDHDTLEHFANHKPFNGNKYSGTYYVDDHDKAALAMHRAVLRHGSSHQVDKVLSHYSDKEYWSGKWQNKTKFSQALAHNPNKEPHHVDKALAYSGGHSGTAAHLLYGMGKDEISRYSKSENPNVRVAAAGIRGKHQLDMIHDPDPGVRHTLSLSMSAGHLHHLIKDEDPDVRATVARRIDHKHLHKMFTDPNNPEAKPHEVEPDAAVRRTIVRRMGEAYYNPQKGHWDDINPTGEKHMHKFMDDPDEDARHTVAYHVSDEHLHKYADHNRFPDVATRGVAAGRIKPEEAHVFANDPDPHHVRYQASRRANEHTIGAFINDDNSAVRSNVSEKLPADQLHHMIGHPNNGVNVNDELAKRLPPEHLATHLKNVMADKVHPQYQNRWAMSNGLKRMPFKDLHHFMNADDEHLREYVANRVPEHHLHKMVNDESSMVRRAVSARLPDSELHLMDGDPHPKVQENIAIRKSGNKIVNHY